EAGLHVDVPCLTEVFPGELVDGAHWGGDASIEDKDGRPDLLEYAPCDRLVCDVTAFDVYAEPLRNSGQAAGAACDDGDPNFSRHQRFDDAEPEPAASSGDDGPLSFESFHDDGSLLSPSTI